MARRELRQPSTESIVHTGPQLGFQSLEAEVSVDQLPVMGSFRSGLRGSLLRNGPALFEDGERSVRHWFDGQAMLHRFTIAGGEVSYANRFLRTKAYSAMREQAGSPTRVRHRSLPLDLQASDDGLRPADHRQHVCQPDEARRTSLRDDRSADVGSVRPADARDARLRRKGARHVRDRASAPGSRQRCPDQRGHADGSAQRIPLLRPGAG